MPCPPQDNALGVACGPEAIPSVTAGPRMRTAVRPSSSRGRYNGVMTQLRTRPTESRWPRMSHEEYLGAPDIPEHTEWVNGEVVEMMAVSRRHAELQVYLVELLQAYLRRNPIGRLYQPFQLKTSPELPGRSPDIMFVAVGSHHRLRDQYLEGPADVVIEIVSPGTEAVDRGDKFYEYEAGGVPEYWLIDPVREVADFYVRKRRARGYSGQRRRAVSTAPCCQDSPSNPIGCGNRNPPETRSYCSASRAHEQNPRPFPLRHWPADGIAGGVCVPDCGRAGAGYA